MLKSLFRKLFFDFDRMSEFVFQAYEDKTTHFDNNELITFAIQSYNRNMEIRNFLTSNYKNTYYAVEVLKELSVLESNFDPNTVEPGSLSGKEVILRWNLLTAVFDYIKQFQFDHGVDDVTFYSLYKHSLKKYDLKPLVML